jgi:quinol monooxygenase YgiN
MSITVMVELTVKAEFADGYCVRLQEAFPETRAYDGCEDIVAYRDEQQLQRIVVVERWASRAHYERYIEWRRGQGIFDRLASISEIPISVSFLSKVA